MMRTSLLLHDLLDETALRLSHKTALVCDAAHHSYQELVERSNALASALIANGVERGDRVIVLAENSLEMVVAFWGALKAGAVAVVVHPQTRPAKLEYLLEDSRASAFVSDVRLERTYAGPIAQARHLRVIMIAGLAAARGGCPGALDLDEALAAAPRQAPPRRCLDIDLAAIIYTSGSTGEPKGVMLTHRNMVAAVASISQYLEIREDDVILCVLPLSFDYGLYQMIMAFAAGARVVLERSFAFPAAVLRVAAEHRVTGFPGVPTMFTTLLGMDLAPYDLSTIRYVTNTAAALPVKHALALRDLFPRAKIFSMYGLTECKRCTYLPPADLTRKPDSVGIAIPNTELWLVDEDDRRLGPGEVGQLVIRGATVMRGYWEKPEATARRLRPGPLPGEQVLYTGDLCRLDEEGYLYFVGRMDDIIKSRGEKVAPKAVEAALLDIAGVREAAVIGVPDDLLGHAIKAFVVLSPDVTLDVHALQRECRLRLESFMVPQVIVIRDELPKSANGKIQKTALT
jgi:amino acid adenylation domain-containing protein